MTIHLTKDAAVQVQKQLDKRGCGLGLRLGIRKSGCSGYAYVIDFADQQEDGDEIFSDFGVKLFVNRDHLGFLDGLQVDYKVQGLNASFSFDNPNVKDSCGCGESFSV